MTALLLERYDYIVLAAANGSQALTIFRQHPLDVALVLTDVVMPDMNGRELAEVLRRERPSLKVIFMRGYMDAIASRLGVYSREAAFVEKPFTPATLARKVRAVLDQPSTQGVVAPNVAIQA